MFGDLVCLPTAVVVVGAELTLAKVALRLSRRIAYSLFAIIAIQSVAILMTIAALGFNGATLLPVRICLFAMPFAGTICLVGIAWLLSNTNTVQQQIVKVLAPGATVSTSVISIRFVVTYFTPLVFWFLWASLHDLPSANVSVNLYVLALGIIWFPSGLVAAIAHTADIAIATIIGYFIYLALYFSALTWRKRWQANFCWMLLTVLIVVNLHGCRYAVGNLPMGDFK